ncbi:hypothetical protein JXQ70_18700, partial [bacterium]|nr:hypothetical protein [bacterium]
QSSIVCAQVTWAVALSVSVATERALTQADLCHHVVVKRDIGTVKLKPTLFIDQGRRICRVSLRQMALPLADTCHHVVVKRYLGKVKLDPPIFICDIRDICGHVFISPNI